MMVRPMFFLDGWPTLGPEPYDGAAIVTRPLTELRGQGSGGTDTALGGQQSADLRDWFRRCGVGPVDHGVCYDSWDFETGKNRTVFTGFDKFGVVSWGKLRYNDT